MDQSKYFPESWAWLIQVSIGLSIAILLSLAIKKTVQIIQKRTSSSTGFWRKKVHKIVHLPLQVAIWGFISALIIDVVGTHFGIDVTAKYIRPLKGVFIVGAITWIFLRWAKEAFKHLAKRSEQLGVAASTIYALGKLTSFVISILGLMIIFQIFGFNILPLLTFGGIGVAGVAFAAQDFIANFFGGAMLHFTRSFSIGDEIVIPSRNNFEGVVKEIGWYITVVEDYYRRPVYFPNALFSKTHVINESRRSHRRIKGTITLGYDALPNIEKIVDEIRDKVGAHPDVDETQSYSIQFANFGDSGLEIFFYLLVYKMGFIKFLKAKQEIFLIMEEVVSKHGAEFTYPTQNINLTQVAPKSKPS